MRAKEPSFVFLLSRMVILLSSVTAPGGDGVLVKGHEARVLAGVVLTAEIDRANELLALFIRERHALVLGVHRSRIRHGAVCSFDVHLLDEDGLTRVVWYRP